MAQLRILAVALALTAVLGKQASAQRPTTEQFKQMLELQKLAADTRKAQSDAKYFYMAYLGGGAAFLTIVAGFATFGLQRRGARNDQKNAERANLELKALEYILNSPTPNVAGLKLRIIRQTYTHVLSREFLDATRFLLLKKGDDANAAIELPGTRLYDMKMEAFKQIAGKSKTPDDLIAALAAVFPADEGRIVEKPDKLMNAAQRTNDHVETAATPASSPVITSAADERASPVASCVGDSALCLSDDSGPVYNGDTRTVWRPRYCL